MRFMDRDRQDGRVGRPTFAGLALLVVAFMVLSLLVTATGTARFAVSMGYHRQVLAMRLAPSLTSARVSFPFGYGPSGRGARYAVLVCLASPGSAS